MNTQEIKGSFINSKSQLIIVNQDKSIEYSCDKLIVIDCEITITSQLGFLKNMWNLIEQLKSDKEPLIIPAVNLENSIEKNKICDVQINKVKYDGQCKYHIFMIDAFPFNANFGAEVFPEQSQHLNDEDCSSRQAMISAEKDFIQHYQMNFNDQLSSDFEWPLYQILLSSEALRRQITNSKSLAYINLISQAAEYLNHLSRRNLDFLSYVGSSPRMLRMKTDLLELMDSLYQLFKRDPGSYFKGVKVIIHPDVPRYFTTDVTRTTQVLTNLLSTLIKYGNKGEVILKVSFNGDQSKPVYSFTVQHTGVYIEKDLLPHIFGRNSGNEGNQRSVDIPGLFLVKKMVDMLGGELQVRSTHAEGTFVNMDLPVANVEKRIAQKQSNDVLKALPALPELRILVVEDSSIDRMVLSNALDEFGFMFETAVNGIDALKMLSSQEFDLVIMDLYMPHLDGFQTIGKIRNNIHDRVRKLPVLALSSSGGQSNLQEVVNLGASDYILKPFNRKNLLRKILTLTGNLEVKYLNSHLADENKLRYEVDIQSFRDSSMGDHQFMMSLMENVIDQTEESLVLINRFLLDDNFPALRKVIHKIKPITQLYGIPELDKLLDTAESMAVRQLGFKEWDSTITEIRSLFNQAILSLNNEILNIKKGVFYSEDQQLNEQGSIAMH